jgi:5-hydroxyisourate hydrolase-like protein (transthyretin family)
MILCGSAAACPASVSETFSFLPAKWPDGVHDLAFYARDLNGRTSSKVFEVRIDHTAPPAPQALMVLGGDGWRRDNRFSVSWVSPNELSASPLTGVHYRICPASNGPTETANCMTGRRDGSNVEWMDDISVPRSGVWRLRLALIDEAGNVDLDHGATITNLRLDSDPPQIAFLAVDPSDPARILVAASDDASGVAQVAIEARRHDDDTWRSLKVKATPGRYSAVLDDGDLPAGTYELRAHAIDNVGNERTADQLRDGTVVRVHLPVRGGTVVSVGAVKRGRRPEARPIVPYGKAVMLSGRVTDSFGSPRPGVTVEITEQLAVAGAQWRPLDTVTTDKNGSFAYRAKAGMARTIRFQYAGTPTTRPASSEVALRVRAATTLAPSRQRLRNGETVVLRGRVVGGPVPAAGKVITVQARTRRGWLTFGTARARARDGRWSYRYTFTGTSTTVRYRFRAVVVREEAYPYMRGTSPTVAVVVVGSR